MTTTSPLMPRIWGILDLRSFRVKEKKQTDLQQKQAGDAIYIYYGEETIPEDKSVLSKTNNKVVLSKKKQLEANERQLGAGI